MFKLLFLLYIIQIALTKDDEGEGSDGGGPPGVGPPGGMPPGGGLMPGLGMHGMPNVSYEISAEDDVTANTTTVETKTMEPPVFTEFDFNKQFNVTGENMSEKELEDLTAAAFAAMGNRSGEENTEEEGQVYDWWGQKWEDLALKSKFGVESMLGIQHVGNYEQKLKACYFIGVTYKNAITDIKLYYPIRYLYTNNLHYEVGFLVEEIIVHYQIAVELYHLMVRKYGLKRYRYYAPTPYMLFMYTNILFQCKTILHLCNMLHEIEAKYKDPPNTIFQDIPSLTPHPDQKNQKDGVKNYKQRFIEEQKRRLREQRKAKKKLFKSGFFTSTTRTRRPRKGPFELHYGWSIEDW